MPSKNINNAQIPFRKSKKKKRSKFGKKLHKKENELNREQEGPGGGGDVSGLQKKVKGLQESGILRKKERGGLRRVSSRYF